jgi:hypothetical protein
MKKLITIVLLFATGIAAHSQAFKATYEYDANGNRKTATIIWLSTSLKSDLITDTVTVETLHATSLSTTNATVPKQGYTQPNLDSLAGTKITVYPNPTHGLLLVQLDGFTVETHYSASNAENTETGGNTETVGSTETHYSASLRSSITVYNITGNKIMQLAPLSKINSINLLSQPAGTYILVIQLGSLSKTYTIIKN